MPLERPEAELEVAKWEMGKWSEPDVQFFSALTQRDGVV